MLAFDTDDSDPTRDRIIYLNDTIKNLTSKFLHNRVTTSKYNIFTFAPKFLFEQFSKYANLFFLFVACIQQIGDISPTNKLGTVIPLSVVIGFSACKEVIEDRKRHEQDAAVNARDVKVLRGTTFEIIQWKDIQVGDIVRIENGNFFPADLILLSSSEPDALCYIETSNLDGETNLKIRQGVQETADMVTPEEIAKLNCVIKSELPNNSLYTFEGTLRLSHKEVALDPIQLLLRGAMLRNTRWIYGAVVFTGHETKLMKNATPTPIKRTKLERSVNGQIIYLFILLLSIALICATGTLVRAFGSHFEEYILMQENDFNTNWSNFGLNILTFIILFNNLIPLSLIVSMEFVKFFSGGLINSDIDMYHPETNTPATARTSSLVEELGQIDYIFSDKTGTLTCNMMDFRMSSIGGVGYAEVVPDEKRVRVGDDGKEVGHYDFIRLQRDLISGSNSWVIREFLTLLAVCHTVIPEANEDEPDKIIYQASSPDEGALVKGAASLGFVFTTRKPKSAIITAEGKDQEFEILNICEFNSTRKRMSAVVRTPEGKLKLYVKGADTVILERLSSINNPFVNITEEHLEEYATDGLRTLCIAFRDISEEEYFEWSKIYNAAAITINNRGEQLDKAAELIEKNLILLGATAIEDKLQDGVPDTIHTLMNAGIKVWVLTGDRQETAINIAYSCKLITDEMALIVVNEDTHFETKAFLEEKLAAIYGDSAFHRPPPKKNWRGKSMGLTIDKDAVIDAEPMALVIDGRTLEFALEKDIQLLLLELATMCKAVVCCRVSPLQKALVVKLVKKNVSGSITLAIGDGANDVSMIQAAHVGVGISGMEGLQAARSADFAIAQFRFLRKLLLVHGGWSYARLSKLILYSFYKNITLYLIQLWFATQNGFSGQTIFESWTQSSYNIAFALFQPIAIGGFDQYVNARMLNLYPQMYKIGQRGEFYTNKKFWGWISNSFFQALVMYYFMTWVYGEGTMLSDGRIANHWILGQMIYTADLFSIAYKAALTVDTWVPFTYVAIGGSLAMWFVLFPIYSYFAPMIGVSTELHGINPPMFGSLGFWMAVLLVPLIANFRDFVWKYYKRNYKCKSYHIVQEIQKFNIQDYRPRMETFKKAVQKIRINARQKRARGFAFSQNEGGQADLIRLYDTTRRKPRG